MPIVFAPMVAGYYHNDMLHHSHNQHCRSHHEHKARTTTVRMLFRSLVTVLLLVTVSANKLDKKWMKPKKEGDTVPSVVFQTRVRIDDSSSENPFDWKERTTDDYFANKRVVLFALPGAFTPTCKSWIDDEQTVGLS
jgi:hypothetical protein